MFRKYKNRIKELETSNEKYVYKIVELKNENEKLKLELKLNNDEFLYKNVKGEFIDLLKNTFLQTYSPFTCSNFKIFDEENPFNIISFEDWFNSIKANEMFYMYSLQETCIFNKLSFDEVKQLFREQLFRIYNERLEAFKSKIKDKLKMKEKEEKAGSNLVKNEK